jgi:hypothetical protein
MTPYTPEELKVMEEFIENAFKSVLMEIKSGTSWKNKENLEENFKKYGFTGPYSFLRTFYEDNPQDMLEALYLLWDEVD